MLFDALHVLSTHSTYWFYFHFIIIIETTVNNSKKQSSNDQWVWLCSVTRDLRKKTFVLVLFPSLFPLRDCVLQSMIVMLLPFFPFFKAHVNIIWNSQQHVKLYETAKCIYFFMLVVYMFIMTHLLISMCSKWTKYLCESSFTILSAWLYSLHFYSWICDYE